MRVPGAVTDQSTVSESTATVTAEDGHCLPLHVARPAHPAGPLSRPGGDPRDLRCQRPHPRPPRAASRPRASSPRRRTCSSVGIPRRRPGAEIAEVMRRAGAISDVDVDAVADLRATVERR